MKKILLSLVAAVTLSLSSFGQAPEGFKYQAVVRDAGNTILNNQAVGLRMTIQQGSIGGTTVYAETFAPTTNAHGLVNLEIGNGTVVSGTFANIDWSAGPYFMETAVDVTGGTNYSVMGTSQLMSVPYALYSNCVPVSVSGTGDTLNIGCQSVIIPGISAANSSGGGGIGTYPAGSVFCASGPTAIVDVTNPTTGKIWMDRNLGATQAATSSTDVNSYGDLYQWGRRSDGHQCRTSPTTIFGSLSSVDQPAHGSFIPTNGPPNDWRSPQNANLWQGVNGGNNPCPGGYRLPTEPELDAEQASWPQQNGGAFASPLKLSITGYRYNGPIFDLGNYGYYWSSTVSGTSSFSLVITSGGASISDSWRAYGHTVRCIKD
jgi:uncharacterized protein (TIGR02145 family)